ncbi:phage major capsid protein [Nocardiopsis lucentensis]|uniref:phage major capsid protein n=1 Tax=Nocardiopsis lucentensis TaxID=53441 RepID=UPI0003494D2B|nr:phage major capsid protein [Nocardiopsis lucentensis]
MTWLTTSGTAGGSFAPSEAADYFFDRLAAESVGLQSGFRRETTEGARLEIPRILSDAAANWTPEGDEITVSDPDADVVTAIPRKLAALTFASNELVSDSNPSAQRTLMENLARAIALKLDHGFFQGSGTAPEIRGLRNQTGIQTVSMGTDGAPLTNLDPIADALGMLSEANAEGSAIVMHPRTWRELIKVKESDTGNNKPLLQESAGSGAQGVRRAIYGVPVFLTSQISTAETQGTATDATSVYVYDAPQVVAVSRQEADIQVDQSAGFTSDRTAVRATLRADLVLPNPAAVVRILGVTP